MRIERKCHEFRCWHLCATAGVSVFEKPVVKALSRTGMAVTERAGGGGMLVYETLQCLVSIFISSEFKSVSPVHPQRNGCVLRSV